MVDEKYIYTIIILLVIFYIYKRQLLLNENFEASVNGKSNFERYTKLEHNAYGQIYTFGDSEAISKAISTTENNIWEDHICQIFARYYIPGTDAVDIGANMGLNSIRMNQLNPITNGNKIHLFEPQHDVFTLLEYNTKNLPRVLYNFALSDAYKILNFSPVESNMGGTSMISDPNSNNVHILATKLDNIQFERPVSVVKLDVEGGEAGTLLGGREFFNKHKPTLIIEVWKDKTNEVFPILNNMNYIQIWNNLDDYIFIHESKQSNTPSNTPSN
jgi:FkbM family methyltransferase